MKYFYLLKFAYFYYFHAIYHEVFFFLLPIYSKIKWINATFYFHVIYHEAFQINYYQFVNELTDKYLRALIYF